MNSEIEWSPEVLEMMRQGPLVGLGRRRVNKRTNEGLLLHESDTPAGNPVARIPNDCRLLFVERCPQKRGRCRGELCLVYDTPNHGAAFCAYLEDDPGVYAEEASKPSASFIDPEKRREIDARYLPEADDRDMPLPPAEQIIASLPPLGVPLQALLEDESQPTPTLLTLCPQCGEYAVMNRERLLTRVRRVRSTTATTKPSRRKSDHPR